MAETKKRTNPFTFFSQVRAEARKITWTSRKETIAATIMVLIMVVFASIFFLLTDMVVSFVVGLITGI
ncbi:preprotein translocase subunit SecE [Hirschia litorea]|uniref:Protein translocase subunit SecE n=1 Tax=Hirschia litorea TaxID=1199156 RepID=A0ABW2IG44_9PROT